jgi:hypothetical protein
MSDKAGLSLPTEYLLLSTKRTAVTGMALVKAIGNLPYGLDLSTCKAPESALRSVEDEERQSCIE